jgi:hypothetical protein
MTNRPHDGKSFELHQVLISLSNQIKYYLFQIGSSHLSKSMPQAGGIRSYQVVNDGTDDQFVCEWLFK